MFITFEGIEGTGKSTQIKLLAEALAGMGRSVVTTREPGGSDLGVKLRAILLSLDTKGLTSRAELFLYLADRSQHVAELVKPALTAGKVVLCDRFTDSTVAYQGYGRGLDVGMLKGLNDTAVDGVKPDLTVLLDIDPEQGLRRALARNMREGNCATEGRFEAESLAFHARVREGYLALAALEQRRFALVDASRPIEEVGRAVLAAVKGRM